MNSKQVVTTTFFGRPKAYSPWSAGIVIPPGHGILFTPGMTARDTDGNTVAPGDIRGQTRRVIEQLAAVLGEVGATLDDVVKLTVYLQDMDDVFAVQEIRGEFWPTDPPVSSTVEVGRLVTDEVRIEIEAVAAIAPSDAAKAGADV
jgi:enamine deaminase RidA (YjgF/YER057c/UK114 family)